MTSLARDPNRRIVCLTEEPTEILYLLGEAQRIVGVSAYAVRPPDARRKHPVVSAFTDGSVKKILALEPDLVIGFSEIQARFAAELLGAGLQVVIFNQRSLEEILDVIVSIGRLVGAESKAQALVHSYQERLSAARARAQARKHKPSVYFEEWFDPLIPGIRWVSELIEAVGGQDIFDDRRVIKMAMQRTVTPEEVCARAPEVILASWCGKPFQREQLESRPGFADIPAVRSGRVYAMDPSIILQPGPACFTDGLDALEQLIHQEA